MKNRNWIHLASAAALLGTMLGSSGSAFAEQTKPAQGIYEISAAADQRYGLDICGCTVKSEEQAGEESGIGSLQIFKRLGVNQQKFYLEEQTDGSFLITGLVEGKVMTAEEDGQITGQTYGVDALENQKWKLIPAEGHSWYIQAENGQVLTCELEMPKNNASVVLSNKRNADNQKWALNKTRISAVAKADTDHFNPYEEGGLYDHVWIRIRGDKIRRRISSQKICEWITESEDHSFLLNEDLVRAYVAELAAQYDTQGYPRTFVTHAQETITLYEGEFGWKLDEEDLVTKLEEAVLNGTTGFVDLEWEHTGTSHEKGMDIGDSYVEISLKEQKLWLYEDGEEILSSNVVSGTYGTDRQTPGGVYAIYYKQSPAVLRGPDYESPVTFWMPFNGGIGLHDASWRSEFGGEIYLYSGSHGCINLPYETASVIYDTVEKGFPVVLYN